MTAFNCIVICLYKKFPLVHSKIKKVLIYKIKINLIKFRGYCEDCLKKLKSDYEKALKEHMKIYEQIELFAYKDSNHVSK